MLRGPSTSGADPLADAVVLEWRTAERRFEMINRRRLLNGEIQVTFVLDEARPASVVGDFNDWDPYRNPLVSRSTGLRSAAVVACEGAVLRFRYLADAGDFFDDPDAYAFEDNGQGGTHSVVVASIADGATP